jgi:tellurite resistance protein TehA-like permease
MPSCFSDVARTGGAVVMGTGIVSVALALDGYGDLSNVLLVVAAAVLAAVGAALLGLAIADRKTLRESAFVPGALTWVAATDVVGSRLSLFGWQHEAAVFLAVGVALWLVVVPCVVRRWTTPTVGLSFLLVVGTESIAVLMARLSLEQLALVPFGLGLALYLVVLARFELRQLVVGRGDHWIAGGALAIAALACARCAQAVPGLHTLTLVLWACAAAWLPVLLAAEAAGRRRPFHELRWSTVFPVGMYAACSFAAGAATGTQALTSFARTWVWVAVAIWAAVAVWTARRIA